MSHLSPRPGLAFLAFLVLAAGPLGAAPPKAPKPPAPPESPAVDVDVEVDEEPEGLPAIVRVVHGSGSFIGVHLTELSPELREHFGAPQGAGVMISSVDADSPAAKAGLKVGDVVTKAGGSLVSRASDLSRAVRETEAGGKLSLAIVRDKTPTTLEVAVAARKGRVREVHVGDWGLPQAWNLRIPEFDQERFGRQMERLKEKLAALEAKMKELEKRFSAK